ncbi:hypothetical protein ACJX0J_040716, partial [Zea mays]
MYRWLLEACRKNKHLELLANWANIHFRSYNVLNIIFTYNIGRHVAIIKLNHGISFPSLFGRNSSVSQYENIIRSGGVFFSFGAAPFHLAPKTNTTLLPPFKNAYAILFYAWQVLLATSIDNSHEDLGEQALETIWKTQICNTTKDAVREERAMGLQYAYQTKPAHGDDVQAKIVEEVNPNAQSKGVVIFLDSTIICHIVVRSVRKMLFLLRKLNILVPPRKTVKKDSN